MPKLRQAPSGPVIVGTNIGDVLVWNGTEWLPGAAGGGSAFDHVVESLADLPAPAAGVITLTDGSWAFKAPIDVGANVVRVPSGTTVLLKGMGGFNEKVLSGDGASVLDVQGSAYIETLSVDARVGVALALSVNASVASFNCHFQGTLQAVDQSAGGLRDSLSRISGGTDGYTISDGTANLVGTRITAGTDGAVVVSGTATKVECLGCRLSASDSDTVTINSATVEVELNDTEVICQSAVSTCVLNELSLSLQVVGGRWQGSGFRGLDIDGNITRMLQVSNVAASALASMFVHSSGTVRQATISGCASFSDVAVGVTWASADIPTNGLALVGNTFDTATPISGFTAASARVNSKANVALGALMQETAIVP